MYRTYGHAMPAIGMCLLLGIVQASACSWVPAGTRIVQADTTALGIAADLSPASLWPGEPRRIALPPIATKPGTRLLYEIRGDPGIEFSLKDESGPFVPIVRGMIVTLERPEITTTPTPAPPPEVGPVIPEPTRPPNLTAPSFCIVRSDMLATPGDTISAWYTISTVTQPPRKSTWRVRIVVTAAPSPRTVRAAPIYVLKVYPNPCNPSTTVSFRTRGPATVRLVVFNATGRVVTQFDRHVSGYKTQSITWNGTDGHGRPVASGVYLIRVQADDELHTRKVILLK